MAIEGLTVELYLKYKRKQMTDEQISKLFDVHREKIRLWKKSHGLEDVVMDRWETWEKYWPEDVAELKRKYKECVGKGWSDFATAEELKMTRGSFHRFKARYFPDDIWTHKSPTLVFTPAQKRVITQRELDPRIIRRRMKELGKTFEQAVDMGKTQAGRWRGNPGEQKVGKKKRKELPVDYKPKTTKKRKKMPKRQNEFRPRQIESMKELGISKSLAFYRVNVLKWTKQRAATEPVHNNGGRRSELQG